jgi:two-component system, NtrC family, response regulator HydG
MERRVLLVEDDQIHREMLIETMAEKGFAVTPAATGQEALDATAGQTFDVALIDIRLPDTDGFALFEHLLERQPECSVLLMTGQATIEAAVTAMKRGAHDYLAKPFRMELLLMKLDRVFHLKKLERENRQLKGQTPPGGIVGNSLRMRRFLTTVGNVAGTGATVLIQGESGTGKEMIAELIHSLSTHPEGPMIKVNCGAIPEGLMEAELFGYEKGAFTGADRARRGYLEQAHGGTLFLDEIGEIPHAMQVKLLRVLQDHRVQRLGSEAAVPADFRLVAATHRNLEELRDAGTIREDFYYRLNIIPLVLPPLRERRGDLPLLIDHFIRKFSVLYEKEPIRISPDAFDVLLGYHFPGNVRELANLIERLQILAPGEEIDPRRLPPEYRRSIEPGSEMFQCFRTELPLREALHDFELRFIHRVLQEEGGNRTAAARRLGISRKGLWEKLSD